MASLLGWTATVLFTIMLVPQIIKTVKLRNVQGVSPWVAILDLVANVVALFYAMSIQQSPLVVKYSIAIPIAIISVIVFERYKGRR